MRILPIFSFLLLLSSCETTGGGASTGASSNSAKSSSGDGMESSNSEPINDKEAAEYKKAVLRCYKTGGSRIVKITGSLRCY